MYGVIVFGKLLLCYISVTIKCINPCSVVPLRIHAKVTMQKYL